jgi:parvulin-like peptidyl-prolyl isomerase
VRRLGQRDDSQRHPAIAATGRRDTVVARVFDHVILVGQLERALANRLRRAGRTPEQLTADQLRAAREAALDELIDHQLLRVKTKSNAVEVPVSEAEIDAELARFRKGFDTPEEMAAAMRTQGIASERELRFRLAGRLQQEQYLAWRIGPRTTVSDADVRQWYEEHRSSLVRPERVRARHVFIATLERDATEARETLARALARLHGGATSFPALAAELSEDERTKTHGGDLGWFSRARLPADFTAAVFALPNHTPTLVRTKLGWHLVEVLDRKSAEPIPFAAARPAVLAALESARRTEALQRLRIELRTTERQQIHIHREVLDAL